MAAAAALNSQADSQAATAFCVNSSTDLKQGCMVFHKRLSASWVALPQQIRRPAFGGLGSSRFTCCVLQGRGRSAAAQCTQFTEWLAHKVAPAASHPPALIHWHREASRGAHG